MIGTLRPRHLAAAPGPGRAQAARAGRGRGHRRAARPAAGGRRSGCSWCWPATRSPGSAGGRPVDQLRPLVWLLAVHRRLPPGRRQLGAGRGRRRPDRRPGAAGRAGHPDHADHRAGRRRGPRCPAAAPVRRRTRSGWVCSWPWASAACRLVVGLAEQVRDAQRARGLSASPRAFAVPLVVRSLRHADALGDALVARGVDDDHDTRSIRPPPLAHLNRTVARKLGGIPIREVRPASSATGTARPGPPPRPQPRPRRHPGQPLVGGQPTSRPGSPPAVQGGSPARARTVRAYGQGPGARPGLRQTGPRTRNYQQTQKKRSPIGWWIAGAALVVVIVIVAVIAIRAVTGGGRCPRGTPGGQATQDACPPRPLGDAVAHPAPADGRVHGGPLSYPTLGSPWALRATRTGCRSASTCSAGVHGPDQLPARPATGSRRCWSASCRPVTGSSPPSRARRSWSSASSAASTATTR